MRIIAAFGSGIVTLLATSTLRAIFGWIFEIVRAIPTGMLFGTASEDLRLELAILSTEMLDFCLQLGDAFQGVSVAAFPVTGLLPQFEVLAPQPLDLGTQFGNFTTNLGEEFVQRR